jgi:hypothetical protein
MAWIIARTIAAVLEMDHIGTEVMGDTTVYTFKTTSLIPSLTELKSKILSVLDFPIDIPKNVEVQEVKKGKVFKEYVVKIYVDRGRIGELSDLMAKKYGIIRKRKYSGEP